MKITPIKTYNPQFKAHYYDFKTDKNTTEIKIDDNSKLGNEPEFVYKVGGADFYNLEMLKVGKYYVSPQIFTEGLRVEYSINYVDTGKKDNKNGANYILDTGKLGRNATLYDKKVHRQSLLTPIKVGSISGKLIVAKTLKEVQDRAEKLKVPIIAVVPKIDASASYLSPKIQGLFLTNESLGLMAHASNQISSHTTASAMVFDKKIIDEFKKHNEQFVKVDVMSNNIGISKIDRQKITSDFYNKDVEIEKMNDSDKILLPEECQKGYVGPKAYNLSRLKQMSSDGTLHGVNVPDFYVLPHSFILKMYDENSDWQGGFEALYYDISQKENHKLDIQEIDVMKACLDQNYVENPTSETFKDIEGIRKNMTDEIIIRSAFNGEDMENYSAAGLYDSFSAQNTTKDIYRNVFNVAKSKWNKSAHQSRFFHNIDHRNVNPSVIVQNKVPVDYTFTLYTQSRHNPDLLKLEMYSKTGNENKQASYGDIVEPYYITYNRKTRALKLESIERIGRKITFDENFNVFEEETVDDELKKNPKKYKPIIQKLVENSLILEEIFGKPQDIEGGILNGELYFWQTRNIVK